MSHEDSQHFCVLCGMSLRTWYQDGWIDQEDLSQEEIWLGAPHILLNLLNFSWPSQLGVCSDIAKSSASEKKIGGCILMLRRDVID